MPAGALVRAVGMLAFYIIAANVLIRTRLLHALINDGPEKIAVEYSSACSLCPGRVRVKDLGLSGEESQLQLAGARSWFREHMARQETPSRGDDQRH